MYRRELGDWIFDDRRRKEQESEAARDRRTPLYGHDTVESGRTQGFNPDNFDLKSILRTSQSRPAH
jgi:hypothetical protein